MYDRYFDKYENIQKVSDVNITSTQINVSDVMLFDINIVIDKHVPFLEMLGITYGNNLSVATINTFLSNIWKEVRFRYGSRYIPYEYQTTTPNRNSVDIFTRHTVKNFHIIKKALESNAYQQYLLNNFYSKLTSPKNEFIENYLRERDNTLNVDSKQHTKSAETPTVQGLTSSLLDKYINQELSTENLDESQQDEIENFNKTVSQEFSKDLIESLNYIKSTNQTVTDAWETFIRSFETMFINDPFITEDDIEHDVI